MCASAAGGCPRRLCVFLGEPLYQVSLGTRSHAMQTVFKRLAGGYTGRGENLQRDIAIPGGSAQVHQFFQAPPDLFDMVGLEGVLEDAQCLGEAADRHAELVDRLRIVRMLGGAAQARGQNLQALLCFYAHLLARIVNCFP